MTAIIVVDDQASNRRIMTKLAASVDRNAVIVAFENPLEALKYLETNTPDLLITDFKMQPIDGDEFIRRFRSFPACATVPAVVITSHHDVEFRRRAHEAGSTDFLLSPLNYEDFRARSRSLLAQGHLVDNIIDRPEPLAATAGQVEMMNGMLLTVNDHLAVTLANLDCTRGDLNSLIAATQIAAIFVDRDMLIRSFTPAVTSLFELKPNNIGMSLIFAVSDLTLPDLAENFRHVRATGDNLETYVHSRDEETHYLMTILPCRSGSSEIGGAIITFKRVLVSCRGQS